jgi:hypothetical protein
MEFKYPLVTDIIGRLNAKEWRSIPLDALFSAMLNEKHIKESCLYPNSLVQRNHQEYINVFTRWKENNIRQVVNTSMVIDEDDKRFTVVIDLIAELNDGSVALIDIKIGKDRQKEWPIQLAAYKYLAEQHFDGIDKFFVLNIRNDVTRNETEGKKLVLSAPQIEACEVTYGDLTPYWSIFSSALACYQYFETKE